MKEEKLGVGTLIWACTAFWLLSFFGSAIPMIWNGISNFISGYGYEQGSFGYLVLQFLSMPIGVALACMAIKSITKGIANILCIINMSIAATFYFTINTMTWIMRGSGWDEIVGMYLACAVYIIFIVEIVKDIKKNTQPAPQPATTESTMQHED